MRVKWPKLLLTDSERLVFHDWVPLLSDSVLCVPNICDAKKVADAYSDTIKHVGQVEM